jgi:hypothetical protein
MTGSSVGKVWAWSAPGASAGKMRVATVSEVLFIDSFSLQASSFTSRG